MWFIIGVKEFHQGGATANEAKFRELAARSVAKIELTGEIRTTM